MDPTIVKYVDLGAQYEEEKAEIHAAVERAFRAGHFVGGAILNEFEAKMANYLGVPEVVGVASGTDALILGLLALGVKRGDEVITPPNSFVASTAAVLHIGAKPVFADVLPDQNMDPAAVEAVITDKTKAIMPVHLTGRACDMDAFVGLSEKYGIPLIEDAAQAIGSKYKDKFLGSFGAVGAFSAHPIKNLNAAGDAGFMAMQDAEQAERIRLLRNHGLQDRNTLLEWGVVSRLDTLQSSILLSRMERLDSVAERRRRNAKLYRELITAPEVLVPSCREWEYNTYHTFVVQVPQRDHLKAHLLDKGIKTAIHYPIPIHLQPAAQPLGHKLGDFPVTEAQSKRILSLPIHQFLTEDQVAYVSETINAFYKA